MSFIKFYNVFMDVGEKKISPIIWYWLSLLYTRWIPYYDWAEVTISKISEEQRIYNNRGRITENKENTLKQIMELEHKGLISLLDKIHNDRMKFDRILRIKFADYGSFEMIPRHIYELSDDPYENYAVCCIYRFEQYYKRQGLEKGFEKKLSEWANVLSCSENKAIVVIRSLVDKNIIRQIGWDKTIGESGQWSSTSYEYFINYQFDTKQPVTVVDEHLQEDKQSDSSVIVYGNWKGRENLTDKDFIIFAEQEGNEEFVKVANAKIIRITKNGTNEKAQYKIDQGIEEARRVVKHKLEKQAEVDKEKREYLLKQNNVDKLLMRNNDGVLVVLERNSFDKMGFEEFVKNYSNGKFVLVTGEISVVDPFERALRKTQIKVYEKMIELLNEKGSLEYADIRMLCEFRTKIVNGNNKDKSPDEEWEGDLIVDQNGTNSTRITRIQEIKRKEEREARREKEEFMESLFE